MNKVLVLLICFSLVGLLVFTFLLFNGCLKSKKESPKKEITVPTLPVGPKPLASFTTGEQIKCIPAISDGMAYFGSMDGYFYAINITTMSLVWKLYTGDPIPYSPIVCNDRVYAPGGDKNLYCLDARTGKEYWRFGSYNSFMQQPVMYGHMLYIGNHNGTFYCLDPLTGKALWRFETSTENNIFLSQASASNGTIYFGSEGSNLFYALDAKTGEIKWSFNIGPNVSATLTDGDIIYYVSDNVLYALNATSGNQIWRFQSDRFISDPDVAGDTIYFGSCDKNFYALDKYTGSIRWKTEMGFCDTSKPVIYNRSIYFTGGDCSLYSIDANSGQIRWCSSIGPNCLTRFPTSITICNNRIYFGSIDGNFYVYPLQ